MTEHSRSQTPDASDAALIARVQAGDLSAFNTLFHQWFPPLVNFAMGYVDSKDIAEEVVFDVFMRIWNTRGTWSPAHGLAAYLFSAVRNRALNARRDAQRAAHRAERYAASEEVPGMSTPPLSPDVAIEIESDDQLQRVWTAVEALTPARRVVLTLRWQHQLSWEEIAESLGLSVEMVRKHHTRGIADLRKILSPDGG